MKSILFTGFVPFGKNIYNPSETILDFLKKEFTSADVKVETKLLPVSYQGVDAILNEVDFRDFHQVFMFGLASDRLDVTYESRARNYCDTSKLDNDGQSLSNSCISEESKSYLYTSVNLDHLENFQLSEDAGGYVCNYLYYRVLESLDLKKQDGLFIHLPLSEKSSIQFKITESTCFNQVKSFLKRQLL